MNGGTGISVHIVKAHTNTSVCVTEPDCFVVVVTVSTEVTNQ